MSAEKNGDRDVLLEQDRSSVEAESALEEEGGLNVSSVSCDNHKSTPSNGWNVEHL